MKKSITLDKTWIGLIIGLIVPLIAFFIFFLFQHGDDPFFKYLKMLHQLRLIFKVLSLCVLVDLPFFYGFIQLKYWRGSRGVLMACFLYGFAVMAYTIIF